MEIFKGLEGASGQGLDRRKQGGTNDAGTIACIYNKACYRAFKSEEAGHPIFENEIYIRIITGGQKRSTADRKLKEDDKQRFPHIWEAFEEKKNQALDGIPIEELPGTPESIIQMLKGNGIYTIEAMASMPDVNLGNFGMNASELKKRAQVLLENKDEKTIKLEEAEKRIADLEGTVEKLLKTQEEASANPPRKPRGRPKKNVSSDTSSKPVK